MSTKVIKIAISRDVNRITEDFNMYAEDDFVAQIQQEKAIRMAEAKRKRIMTGTHFV
jgi:hypothetical protein